MIISLIAAIDRAGGIGEDSGLPWHLSDDLKHFKRVTMGHHLLMGRFTYESMPGKLPGRTLIVLSRDANFQAGDAHVAASLEDGIALAETAGESELFIIGGAQVFAAALPLTHRFYRTRVDAEVSADTYFPRYDETQWKLLEAEKFDQGGGNDWGFSIEVLERKRSK